MFKAPLPLGRLKRPSGQPGLTILGSIEAREVLLVGSTSASRKRILRPPHEDEESFQERVLAEAPGSTGS